MATATDSSSRIHLKSSMQSQRIKQPLMVSSPIQRALHEQEKMMDIHSSLNVDLLQWSQDRAPGSVQYKVPSKHLDSILSDQVVKDNDD